MKLPRAFLKLWIGQTISELGTWLGALGLLAILQLNATPAQMGLFETLRTLPVLLIGLFAGVWVDRACRRPNGRRQLLIGADLGRALLLGGVVAAALTGLLQIEHLYVAGFLIGCCTILFDNAWHAYLPALVPGEALVAANSRVTATTATAEILSPGLGGLLVQRLGAPLTVLFDAFSFLASAFFIHTIGEEQPPTSAGDGQDQHVWREIQQGLRLVGEDGRLRAITAAAATTRFFGGVFQAVYGLYILRVLGLNPATMGLMVGAGGLGSLAAAFVVDRIARRKGLGRTMMLTLFAGGALQLFPPLAALPGAPVLLFVLISQLCGDIFGAAYSILATSLRQRITPLHALGRVNASFEFLAGGLGVIGIFCGGLLGERIGMTTTLVIAASGIALASGWLWPLTKLEDG